MGLTIDQQWQDKEKKALLGGGESRIQQQKNQGKLTARQRLNLLLDFESFIEIDQLAYSPFLENKIYTDGVITGFGTINQTRVAVYAQDFTIKGGSLGKQHAKKICKVMDMALKTGCPIIGIIDSGGARIDEGIHALAGYGEIFKRNVLCSGVVPQISIILGPCAGGAVYSPALTDFIFMTEKISQMFITGPQIIQQAVHETITKEDLGGTTVHATTSGVAHITCPSEEDCLEKVKVLLSYLPSSYLDQAPKAPQDQCCQTPTQGQPIQTIVPQSPNQPYDIKKVIDCLTNSNSFFEIQPFFAPNIVVGFARMEEIVTGIVANQPLIKAGTIDIDASCKAARFITFCNNFQIPIISLVDTPGYLPGIDQEHNGIIRHGAKLLYAYANATIPKITLVLRKAFGGAFIVMGSKQLGADFNFAWPEAQIAILGASGAVSIMHGKTLATKKDKERQNLRQNLEKSYEENFLNPFTAAHFGYIDAIIEPASTRGQLIKALKVTRDKVEPRPARKNGNIPL